MGCLADTRALNMETYPMTKNVFIKSLLTAGVLLAAQAVVNFSVAAQQATVITLTQTACQFVETVPGVSAAKRSCRNT